MLAEREPIVPENHVPQAVFAEAIRPPVLTQKMKVKVSGQQIKTVLESYYLGREMSLRQVGKEFGVDHETVRRRLKRLEIKVRSRSEATSVFWKDPERKQARINQVSSRSNIAKVNAARATLLRRYHENHPEIAKNLKERQKKAMEARMRQAFGDNPADTLRAWHWQEGLTIAEIARKVGRSWMFVSRAMVNSGVERRGAYIKYLQDLMMKIQANLPASDWFDIFSPQRLRDRGVIDGDHQQRTIDIFEGIVNRGRRLQGVTGQDGIGDISFGQFYKYLVLCLQFMETNPDKESELQAVAKG